MTAPVFLDHHHHLFFWLFFYLETIMEVMPQTELVHSLLICRFRYR